MSILIVGAGTMAREYFRVTDALKIPSLVIGRGLASARDFEVATGHPVMLGGLSAALTEGKKLPQMAIVCVGVEQLAETTRQLIRAGVGRILVEKPAAITTLEIDEMLAAAREHAAQVFVAYNRRFYASTRRAVELIKEDGGVTSCHFEFTEWAHEVEKLSTPGVVKERWLLANSTHVIDLAWFIAGAPARLTAFQAGQLSWHVAGSAYAGSGITTSGALFSYCANWDSAGRWGIEICTRRRRFLLRPMEKLQVMNRGSVCFDDVRINDEPDRQFKPGLLHQVRAFLQEPAAVELCTLEEHREAWNSYCSIAGYQ